ncbi:MAG: terminase family protein [Treponema sp.]|jgi:hypothetical protein|nr:terminase family protein [Treponema sp.]
MDRGDAERNILWEPHPKQAEALKSAAFELLYGGAAGGGKSDFLLMDFLGGVNRWNGDWLGILFRKTYPELEALIRRAKQLYLPLGAVYHEQKKNFTFPNGAELWVRPLERDDDVTKYQGQQFTWAGFDELGNYASDYCWRYLISRLRSAAGAPCYIRGTANPGGRGHAWIKNRFIDGFEPGKVYRVPVDPEHPEVTTTRCFIPARLGDNPSLTANDPGYRTRMGLLPGRMRRALLEGDWDIFAGQVFDEWRRERHVVKPFALEPGQWKTFYSLDWGFARPFSLGKWAVNGEGRMVRYGEWYGCSPAEMNTGLKLGAEEAAAKAWGWAVREGVTECVADGAMWSKEDKGPSVAEKWMKAGFTMIRADKDRMNGLAMFHQYLMNTGEDGRPMLLVFDHCVDFLRIIPTLTPDPGNPEDVDTALEDHIYDEARYALMSRFAHNPADALRRQHGDWNLGGGASRAWDPMAIDF